MEWGRIRGFSLSPDLKRLAAQRIDAGWAQEKGEKQRADAPEEDEEIRYDAPATDLAAYVLTPELRGEDRAIVLGF